MDVSPGGSGAVEVDKIDWPTYPFTFPVYNGASVHLEAVPASGYHFNNWSGDLSGVTNPTTMLVDCNKNITANFSQITHTLTMQVNGSGSANPAAGTHSYGEGNAVVITATPDSGWQFDGWTGDVADSSLATTTATIDSDKTFTANFSQVKSSYWLTGVIIAAAIIIGGIIWLASRRRTA